MSEIILEVKDLEKSFGGLKILKGVNFTVNKGQRLALIGPNGAGKSTLLNAIGGQGPATGGKILFDGIDITNKTPNQRLHLGMGKSFQVNNLFWQMDIFTNIEIAVYGCEKNHYRFFTKFKHDKAIIERGEYLLKTIGLYDKRHEKPGSLSYGEQRMLEMAMAFASNPKMVCLDEPSAGLPTAEVGKFIEILNELAQNTTLLFCAHDMDLVFALSDEIMVLYFGTIIAKSDPDSIAHDPKVKEIYLGGDNETYDIERG